MGSADGMCVATSWDGRLFKAVCRRICYTIVNIHNIKFL